MSKGKLEGNWRESGILYSGILKSGKSGVKILR